MGAESPSRRECERACGVDHPAKRSSKQRWMMGAAPQPADSLSTRAEGDEEERRDGRSADPEQGEQDLADR
jgi:hypothetical protein